MYCQHSCCQCGLFLLDFKMLCIAGTPWVGSDLQLWSCHWLQAILFHARGGYRSGEEHQGVTSSPALSLRPPRARQGLVECARLELSSWPLCSPECEQIHHNSAFHAQALFVFSKLQWKMYPAGYLFWYPLLLMGMLHCGYKSLFVKRRHIVQVASGRQLTICTPPPASDAGLERQKHAQQQRWPLYFRAVEASRYIQINHRLFSLPHWPGSRKQG